jgi:hypothetical protein
MLINLYRDVEAEKTKPPIEAASILRSQYFPDAVASGWGQALQ